MGNGKVTAQHLKLTMRVAYARIIDCPVSDLYVRLQTCEHLWEHRLVEVSAASSTVENFDVRKAIALEAP